MLEDRAAARWLCEEAGSFDGDELLTALDEPATQRMVAHLDAMVARYRSGEPLQYALGRWAFRRLDVMVDRRVLIPRPETEVLVEVALAALDRRAATLVDLGTGSGAIGLALASELPLTGTTVWLTDVSTDALDVARANLAGIGRAAANVRVAEGEWFDALPEDLRGTLDLVVSNPPTSPTTTPRWTTRCATGNLLSHCSRAPTDSMRCDASSRRHRRGCGRAERSPSSSATRRPRRSPRSWPTPGFTAVSVTRDLAGHPRVALGRLPA